jgi:hypothetical protein
MVKPLTAGELLVDLARIQQKPSRKAEIESKWRGKVWGNDELTRWARWSWIEGTK